MRQMRRLVFPYRKETIMKRCQHDNCGCRDLSLADQRDQSGSPDPRRKSATNPANRNDPTEPAGAHNPGHHTSFNPAQGCPAIRSNTEAGKRD